jgi:hypothetical protein
MRWVRARQNHKCSVCSKVIWEEEICIQSHTARCFYHEGCHEGKFGNSSINQPTNERPMEE